MRSVAIALFVVTVDVAAVSPQQHLIDFLVSFALAIFAEIGWSKGFLRGQLHSFTIALHPAAFVAPKVCLLVTYRRFVLAATYLCADNELVLLGEFVLSSYFNYTKVHALIQ